MKKNKHPLTVLIPMLLFSMTGYLNSQPLPDSIVSDTKENTVFKYVFGDNSNAAIHSHLVTGFFNEGRHFDHAQHQEDKLGVLKVVEESNPQKISDLFIKTIESAKMYSISVLGYQSLNKGRGLFGPYAYLHDELRTSSHSKKDRSKFFNRMKTPNAGLYLVQLSFLSEIPAESISKPEAYQISLRGETKHKIALYPKKIVHIKFPVYLDRESTSNPELIESLLKNQAPLFRDRSRFSIHSSAKLPQFDQILKRGEFLSPYNAYYRQVHNTIKEKVSAYSDPVLSQHINYPNRRRGQPTYQYGYQYFGQSKQIIPMTKSIRKQLLNLADLSMEKLTGYNTPNDYSMIYFSEWNPSKANGEIVKEPKRSLFYLSPSFDRGQQVCDIMYGKPFEWRIGGHEDYANPDCLN